MWPWLLVGAGLLLFGRRGGGSTSSTSGSAGQVPALAAQLATALLSTPDALRALARAMQRDPSLFAHTDSDVRRIAAALAAHPEIADQLASELRASPDRSNQLARALATDGALAMAATEALRATIANAVPQVQATPPPPAPPPSAPPSPPFTPPPAPPAPPPTPAVPATRVEQGRRTLTILAERGLRASGARDEELQRLQAALGVSPADGSYSTQTDTIARAAVYGAPRVALSDKARAGVRVLELFDDPTLNLRGTGAHHAELQQLQTTLGVSPADGSYSTQTETAARTAVAAG